MSRNEEHVALVEKFWAYFAENDFENALALWSDDAMWWINGETSMSGWTSKAQFVEWGKGAIPAMFPTGLKMTMNEVWTVDDLLIAQSHSVAMHHSGNEYRNQYVHFFRIKDGKIVEVKEYADTEIAQRMLTQWK